MPADQGEADAEQTEHEQPVRPGVPGPGVERGLHRPDGDAAQEALGGRAAVDPALAGRGGVAEAEGLVEEGPQEDEPGQQAQGREGVGLRGVRVGACRHGGLGGGGGPVPAQRRQVEARAPVRVLVHGHGGDPFGDGRGRCLTPLTLVARAACRRMPKVRDRRAERPCPQGLLGCGSASPGVSRPSRCACRWILRSRTKGGPCPRLGRTRSGVAPPGARAGAAPRLPALLAARRPAGRGDGGRVSRAAGHGVRGRGRAAAGRRAVGDPARARRCTRCSARRGCCRSAPSRRPR